MKISTKGRYALRMMVDLALYQGRGFVALKDVAERQDISKKYLEQIGSLLGKAGLLTANRGSQGGYRLARGPADITVGDILRTTEGSLAPVACLEGSVNTCDRQAECFTLPVWQGLYNAVEKYVDSVSLQDIVDNSRNNTAGDYVI